MEPDGIRNGSNTNERMTNTNSSTGKNEREYSTRVCRASDPPPSASSLPQKNLSRATTIPLISVRTVNINARFMLNALLSLINTQDGQERLLRNLDGSYLFHSALAGLLLLQELSLTAHIAAIALRRHVLAQRLDRAA